MEALWTGLGIAAVFAGIGALFAGVGLMVWLASKD